MKDGKVVIEINEADYYFLVFILGHTQGQLLREGNKPDAQRVFELYLSIQGTAVAKKPDGPQS